MTKKFYRIITLSITVLLLVITGLATWLVMTESGLNTAVSLSQKFVPNLTIQSAQGRLYDSAELEGISYKIDKDNEIAINHLAITWQAKRLREAKLMLDSLEVKGVDLTLNNEDAESASEGITLPEVILPFNIEISRLQVTNVSLMQEQVAQTVISELVASVNLNQGNLTINELSVIKENEYQFGISGDIQLLDSYPASLSYRWHYLPKNSAKISAQGKIKGDVAELIIEQNVTEPVSSYQMLTLHELLADAKWKFKANADTIDLAVIDSKQLGELHHVLLTASGSLNSANIAVKGDISLPELPDMKIDNVLTTHDLKKWDTVLNITIANQPTELTVKGEVNNVNEDIQLAFTGGWQHLLWPMVDGQAPAITSQQGQFSLTGSPDAFKLQSELDIVSQQENIQVTLAATGSNSNINVERLTLAGLGGDADLTGNANWQTLPLQFSLDGKWKNIRLPESLTSLVVALDQGSISLNGTAEDYKLSATSSMAINSQAVDISIAAQGNGAGLEQVRLQSNIADGNVAYEGKVNWQQALSLSGNLSFDKLNPKIVLSDWPGDLSGSGQLAFSQTDESQPKVDINNLTIKGDLRQRPLNVNADLHYAEGNLVITELLLKSGKSLMTIAGELREKMAFNWQINSPDLADFYPELSGTLKADGEVNGTLEQPKLIANLSAQKLRYAKLFNAGDIKGDVALDLQQQGQSLVTLDLKGVNVDTIKGMDAQLKLTGNNQQHQLSVNLKQKDIKVDLVANGQYEDNAWQGQLNDLKIDSKQMGLWSMTKSTPIILNQALQKFGRHCLASGQSTLCIAASHDATTQNWQSDGQITQFPVSLIHDFVIDLEQLTGDINGEFQLAGQGAYPSVGHGKLDLSNGLLKLVDNQLTSQPDITFKQAKISFDIKEDATLAQLVIEPDLKGTSPIVGDISFGSIAALVEQPETVSLSGKLTSKVEDLAVFDALSPAYENLKGELTVDVNLAGTVAKPSIFGDILLDKVSVEIPSLGILLTELHAKANANANDGMSFDYYAKSGDGVLSGQGIVSLEPDGWKLITSLKGNDVQLISLPEAYVAASPDLQFEMTAKEARVTGKLHIPSAELAPAQFNMTVTPSKDVVIINQVSIEEESDFPTYVNVAVSLGDKIYVKGIGFESRLTGALTVSGVTTDVLIGNGEIVIRDGSYLAYGQKLVIDDSKIMFAGGAVDNPNLDVKAVRKGSNFTAGLKVQGSASDPQISLFSEPVMDQSDILAHLILGRPLAEASVTDAALLATAATGLGVTGGGQMSDQIASTFGLDTLAISGNGGEDTALQVGKYLSPKLYLGYGIGIFEPVSTVTLRYKLSKIWSIKAESGVEAGVDFLYTHETKN